jgi:hypothetical protein
MIDTIRLKIKPFIADKKMPFFSNSVMWPWIARKFRLRKKTTIRAHIKISLLITGTRIPRIIMDFKKTTKVVYMPAAGQFKEVEHYELLNTDSEDTPPPLIQQSFSDEDSDEDYAEETDDENPPPLTRLPLTQPDVFNDDDSDEQSVLYSVARYDNLPASTLRNQSGDSDEESDYTYDSDADEEPPPLLVRDLLFDSDDDSDNDPAPVTSPRTGLFYDSEEDEWTLDGVPRLSIVRVMPVMLSSLVAHSTDGLFHPFLDPYSSTSENEDDETYATGVDDSLSSTEQGWYRGYHSGRLVRYERKNLVVFPSNKQDSEHNDDESTFSV